MAANGQTIMKQNANGQTEINIPVQHLAAGLYFFKITGNDSTSKTFKITKD